MLIFDISAVHLALPDLARDPQIGASEIGRTMTSYSLLVGSLLLSGGAPPSSPVVGVLLGRPDPGCRLARDLLHQSAGRSWRRADRAERRACRSARTPRPDCPTAPGTYGKTSEPGTRGDRLDDEQQRRSRLLLIDESSGLPLLRGAARYRVGRIPAAAGTHTERDARCSFDTRAPPPARSSRPLGTNTGRAGYPPFDACSASRTFPRPYAVPVSPWSAGGSMRRAFRRRPERAAAASAASLSSGEVTTARSVTS